MFACTKVEYPIMKIAFNILYGGYQKRVKESRSVGVER